jgi:hypothetical protein
MTRKQINTIILINSICSILALLIFMIMFGILSGSAVGGFLFPVALLAMFTEGDPVGIWILLSLSIGLIWIVGQKLVLPK